MLIQQRNSISPALKPVLKEEDKEQTIEFELLSHLSEPRPISLNLSLTLQEHFRGGKIRFTGKLSHDELHYLGVILEDMVIYLAAHESIH
jgi:hypothetical protein